MLVVEKVSYVATQTGGGTAVVSGAAYVLGFTPAEWSVFGVVGGLVIGLVGLAINSYFQWKRLEIDREKVK